MQFLLIIILVVLAVFGFVLYRKLSKSKIYIINAFKGGNVLVYGLRGKGKDLLMQYVIYCRKEEYFSNIDFGYDYNYLKLEDLDLKNTYDNFVNDNVNIIEKLENREGKDVYISDIGNYLPSQYDKILHVKYSGLPIYFSLSRHVYNSNVHCNVQQLSRCWKPLREQCDTFIKCLETKKILGLFILKYRMYDREQSAEEDLRPLKVGALSKKEYKFRKEEFDSKYGEIKEGFLLIPKRILKYDTRVFHEKIFGYKFKE